MQQVPEQQYTLFCVIENDENNSEPFDIYVPANETVSYLKKIIMSQGLPELNDFHSSNLKLWKVNKPRQEINPDELTDNKILEPTWKISDYWKEEPPTKCVHVYIRPPASKYLISYLYFRRS